MALNVNVEKLPRKVLETAVKLNDTLKRIYLTLYSCGEPATPIEIAESWDMQGHTFTCGCASLNPWI